ncbi:WXG100 family type VII secretion target [Alloscardovia criceti]|uniref:WXG100 family type VII secretion target n=1 Tax=Alloscardovia criceti TaxID=356828 RepID=UPI0003776010|nr:WXG100 family type VII secretion target [Alloscardovia criceti]
MPQYHVDSEQIQQAGMAVNASVDEIRTAVTTMYAHLTQLQGSWHGSAASQFDVVIEQWRAAQNHIEQSLQSIQLALTQAAQVYADAETQASQLFAQ